MAFLKSAHVGDSLLLCFSNVRKKTDHHYGASCSAQRDDHSFLPYIPEITNTSVEMHEDLVKSIEIKLLITFTRKNFIK